MEQHQIVSLAFDVIDQQQARLCKQLLCLGNQENMIGIRVRSRIHRMRGVASHNRAWLTTPYAPEIP